MKRRLQILCLLIAAVVCGCGVQDNTAKKVETTEEVQADPAEDEPYTEEIFAMDTYMTVTAYGSHGQEAVEEAVEEIRRLDALLSTGDASSEIAQLNETGKGTLSEDSAYLYERSIELFESTGGRFDIAIYPVMEEWGFPSGEYQVPQEERLKELLGLVDASEISYDKETKEISFGKDGMAIDFGGIAKGYTSGRIMDIFRECGVTSGMVSLGGNVQVYGAKPDGSDWRVAVQSPEDQSEYIGVLNAQDMAVITSGGYERYFEEDGVTYHHIIDPSTGYPADSGLTSVTIVCKDGTLADGLSTSLFLMGKDEALEYWRDHSDEFDTILLTEDGTLYVTEGIAENFSTDWNMNVVTQEGE